MGTYKYYQFKIRIESSTAELRRVLDNILKYSTATFYDDNGKDVSQNKGLNVII